MFTFFHRITFLLAIFVSPIAVSQDYKIPTGVDVFPEKELIDWFIGNTAYNNAYFEYYAPPSGEQKQGVLKGKSEKYGLYDGVWRIEGRRLCLEYHKRLMSALGDCFTAAEVEEETRLYRADGYELYPDGGRLTVVSGNTENL